MTNTENDSPASDAHESPFKQLRGDDGGSQPPPQSKALEAVQEQLAAEKDGRREERFIWIVVCVILIDVLWFRNAPNAVVPLVVLLLEAVVLFILANRMGVDEAKGLFERLIQSITKSNGG